MLMLAENTSKVRGEATSVMDGGGQKFNTNIYSSNMYDTYARTVRGEGVAGWVGVHNPVSGRIRRPYKQMSMSLTSLPT